LAERGSVLISIPTFPQRLKPDLWEGAYGTDESVPFQGRMKLGHYSELGANSRILNFVSRLSPSVGGQGIPGIEQTSAGDRGAELPFMRKFLQFCFRFVLHEVQSSTTIGYSFDQLESVRIESPSGIKTAPVCNNNS
jgi:hypothetical protein